MSRVVPRPPEYVPANRIRVGDVIAVEHNLEEHSAVVRGLVHYSSVHTTAICVVLNTHIVSDDNPTRGRPVFIPDGRIGIPLIASVGELHFVRER